MRRVKLTQGKFAIVDDQDFEYINQWNWCLHNDGSAKRAILIGGKHKTILMHRIVNETPDNLETDHINHDRLDNRRANLRNVFHKQNCLNRHSYKNSSSKYTGVSYRKAGGKWRATIKINGKYQHIGVFENEIEAAKAYDRRAIENFGQYACVNNI